MCRHWSQRMQQVVAEGLRTRLPAQLYPADKHTCEVGKSAAAMFAALSWHTLESARSAGGR